MNKEIVSIELSVISFDGKIMESHTSNAENVIEDLTIREDFDSAWDQMISEGEYEIIKEIDNEMYETACKFIDSSHLEGTINFKYDNDTFPFSIVVTVKRN